MARNKTYTASANTKIKSAEANQNWDDAFPTQLPWTPTFTATGGGFSLGDGSLSGFYAVQGVMVWATVQFSHGTTTNVGAGALRSTMPLASSAATEAAVTIGNCRAIKTSVSEDEGGIYAYGSDLIGFTNSAGNGTNMGVGIPFAWNSACTLQGLFTYFTD